MVGMDDYQLSAFAEVVAQCLPAVYCMPINHYSSHKKSKAHFISKIHGHIDEL